ncbi:MAG: hypothetical protein AB1422_15020 [bacterium]
MKFYVYTIGTDDKKYPVAIWSEEMKYKNTIYCPVNPGHQRAGERMEILSIELRSPKIGDFTWTLDSDGLITDRVAQLFKEAGLTGYELRPVIIKSVRGLSNPESFPKLWELITAVKDGYAHPICEIYLAKECKACDLKIYWSRNEFKYGILVDEKRWNGSDFFRLKDCNYGLVSERVKEVVEKHKLSNIEFTPSNEYRWPEDLAKPI